MNTHVTPRLKAELKYTRKASGLFLGRIVGNQPFCLELFVVATLMFALAINYKLISPPHYFAIIWLAVCYEKFCK